MQCPNLMLLDIAGTLIHDSSRTVDCYALVLEQEGLPLEPAWIREHIGCAKQAVFSELLERNGRSTSLAGDLSRRFATAFEESLHVDPVRPFPEVDDVLSRLRVQGILVGLVTGFNASTAEAIRAACGWEVDVVVGSDQVRRGRPYPDLVFESMRRCGIKDAARVAVAGDTPRDLKMGRAAGCGWNIGLASGSYAAEELCGHPHTHVLPSISMLPEAIGLAGVD